MKGQHMKCVSHAAVAFFLWLTGLIAAEDMSGDISADNVFVDFGTPPSFTEHPPSATGDSADAATNGTWSDAYQWPLIPIHMVLLANGKVLTYGTGEEAPGGQGFFYDVWDPALGLSNPSSHNTLPTTTDTNIFCSAQIVLPNGGNVLISGGSETINSTRNYGTVHSQLFDPISETLALTKQNMHFARWYPTLTTMFNGRVLVQGGRDDTRRPTVTPEIFNPKTGKWRTLSGATSSDVYDKGWFYPRSFAAPKALIVVLASRSNDIWKLDTRGSGSLELVLTIPGPKFDIKSPAVLYDRNKVLVIQGTKDAITIDITNASSPIVAATGSLHEHRYWSTGVALPNGEVLVIGGASVLQSEENAVRYAEVWNPETGKWRVAGTSHKSRLYHSAAILLPDATVLVGGGGRPGPVVNQNAEIYEPSYLFDAQGQRANRPVIVELQDSVFFRELIRVDFANATSIARVSLNRLGSETHSFNMEERMVSLRFKQSSDTNSLQVQFFGSSVTPPGYYMLFLVDSDGVPSVGKVVHLAYGDLS